jgi:hypothetical protein
MKIFFASTGIRTMDRPGPSGSHGSWYPGWEANRWLPKYQQRYYFTQPAREKGRAESDVTCG